MNFSKVIGTVLILISLGLGYIGVNKLVDNTKQVNLLGMKIDASNEKGQTTSYIYLGVAVILLAGGIYTITRAKK